MPMPQSSETGPGRGRARGVGRVIGVAFLIVLGAGLMSAGVFGVLDNHFARAVLFFIGFITIVSVWDALEGN